jgi:hypothetical protein
VIVCAARFTESTNTHSVRVAPVTDTAGAVEGLTEALVGGNAVVVVAAEIGAVVAAVLVLAGVLVFDDELHAPSATHMNVMITSRRGTRWSIRAAGTSTG